MQCVAMMSGLSDLHEVADRDIGNIYCSRNSRVCLPFGRILEEMRAGNNVVNDRRFSIATSALFFLGHWTSRLETREDFFVCVARAFEVSPRRSSFGEQALQDHIVERIVFFRR